MNNNINSQFLGASVSSGKADGKKFFYGMLKSNPISTEEIIDSRIESAFGFGLKSVDFRAKKDMDFIIKNKKAYIENGYGVTVGEDKVTLSW